MELTCYPTKYVAVPLLTVSAVGDVADGVGLLGFCAARLGTARNARSAARLERHRRNCVWNDGGILLSRGIRKGPLGHSGRPQCFGCRNGRLGALPLLPSVIAPITAPRVLPPCIALAWTPFPIVGMDDHVSIGRVFVPLSSVPAHIAAANDSCRGAAHRQAERDARGRG